jgi:hypothetical protein
MKQSSRGLSVRNVESSRWNTAINRRLRDLPVLLMGLLLTLSQAAKADGVLRDGAGARAMSLGGASVGLPDQPLEAMSANPAGLGLITNAFFQLGGVGGFVQGKFSNSLNKDRPARQNFGALPEAALVYPLKSAPFSVGLSGIPEALSRGDWKFVDKPGGLDGATSFGLQRNYAEFIAIRTAVGASWRISDTLAIGLDLGGDYNRNTLDAPYVFQSYPPLRGFKTLLHLRTDGWGVNGTAGILWRPSKKISLGLSYRSMTYFDTEGDASGNAGVQLGNIGAASFRPDFHYDAEVATKLPQIISGGISWQTLDKLRLVSEIDWIGWNQAFNRLDIKLKNGNNADINGLLGTRNIEDVAPLNWQDGFVYRLGAEFAISHSLTARAGYSYGANPVPAATLTPMSAAILEHTITCGLEWHHGRCSIAGAYQYDLPATSHVGTSRLAAGEFSGSSTTVSAHLFALTTGIRF